MKIGRLELSEERLIAVISVAGVLVALAVYMVFYTPLIKRVRARYLECRRAEGKVLECRNVIEAAGVLHKQRILMAEADAHQAIDELTKHGKVRGINFISITSEKIRKAKDSRYKILPVRMEIESAYEDFAAFLGSLDDLEKGLIKVKSFDMKPAEKDPFRLTVDLTVDVYLSGRDDEG
jgi:Tfp pilus assembly protein PilO